MGRLRDGMGDGGAEPDPAIGAFLWQTLFGVWPVDGVVTDALRIRLQDYARKAVRENGTRTSWTDVDVEFEGSVLAWLDSVCDGPCGAGMSEFVTGLEPHFSSDALGQKLLQLLGPGIPDVYQGTELWDDSLVDPDNRRTVDYSVRRRLLHTDEVPPKFAVVRAALRLRRERPASFVGGATCLCVPPVLRHTMCSPTAVVRGSTRSMWWQWLATHGLARCGRMGRFGARAASG